MVKSFFKSAILAVALMVGLGAATSANAYLYQNGAATLAVDPFAPNVVKLQRPTGTTDLFVKFNDGTSATLTNGWSYVSGSAKVFQSFDGTQGAGNSAIAGLDAGYDAVAVVKNNILYQTAILATKDVTYFTFGTSVTIHTTGYVDGIWSRTSPYGQGAL